MSSATGNSEASWRKWENTRTNDTSEKSDVEEQSLLSAGYLERQTPVTRTSSPFWVILCGILLVGIIFQNVLWITYIPYLENRPPAYSKSTYTSTTSRSWLYEEADNGTLFSRLEERQGSDPRR
jgi:hypothetical protein